MSYAEIRSQIKENHQLVKKLDAEIKNNKIPDVELSRLFGELVQVAMDNSDASFRSNNLAANLMAYAYSNIFDATQRAAFQTSTGLS